MTQGSSCLATAGLRAGIPLGFSNGTQRRQDAKGAGKTGKLLCVSAPWRLGVKIYSPVVFIAEEFQSVYTMRMASNEIQPQKVRPLAARLIFAVLKILKENGGEMRGRQVLEEVDQCPC